MKISLFRSVSIFALAAAALTAHAIDAYSNLGSPVSYSNVNGWGIGGDATFEFAQGMQFTASAGGTLAGFQVAMNSYGAASEAYTLQLYTDLGGAYGTLLGTYSGLSTGLFYATTTSALSNVAATGSTVTITNGAKYWLVASSATDLVWSASLNDSGNRHAESIFAPANYVSDLGAFSVQVDPSATSVPAPAAALSFGLLALRRRKRA